METFLSPELKQKAIAKAKQLNLSQSEYLKRLIEIDIYNIEIAPENKSNSDVSRYSFDNFHLATQDLQAKHKAELESQKKISELYQQQTEHLKEVIETLSSQPIIINNHDAHRLQ